MNKRAFLAQAGSEEALFSFLPIYENRLSYCRMVQISIMAEIEGDRRTSEKLHF